jgi:hypothetical protein
MSMRVTMRRRGQWRTERGVGIYFGGGLPKSSFLLTAAVTLTD